MMNIDNQGQLIIISGPSGSGKNTVINELLQFGGYWLSVSVTARKPRPNETDGTEYNFISMEEFEKKISNNEMLEYAECSGNYYGTVREPVEKKLREKYNVILEIEVKGAMKVKEQYPETIMIFITPPTYSELERRLRNRKSETDEKIKERLEISKKEIGYMDQYDYLIINENNKQKKAALEIHSIAKGISTNENNKINQKRIEKFRNDYFS